MTTQQKKKYLYKKDYQIGIYFFGGLDGGVSWNKNVIFKGKMDSYILWKPRFYLSRTLQYKKDNASYFL